jgi:glycosyltransferase involved in cell wall biosynthesis
MSPVTRDRISVCICTFKRPDMLARSLDGVASQLRDSSFSIEVVVADNDSGRSAEAAVRLFQSRGVVDTIYVCQPEQNISLARNTAIQHATGNLIAFIDDDECPSRDWLIQLYRTLKAHKAAGALGPVLPEFPAGSPAWLKRGRFCERPRRATGTAITAADGRTGNVLLARSLFPDGQAWFDPSFGRTGGEDSDFFSRQLREGRVFRWCDEAPVYELVPPERWSSIFYVKRHLRSGTQDGEWMREGRLPSSGQVVRNALILCACMVLAPVSMLMPKQIWVSVLRKLAYCGGVLTAYYGMSVLRYRD